MLCNKSREFKVHSAINLENLVPETNFYRKLEAQLDLSFVRELVAGLYSPLGRPSIDPVVFFKLQLIMFFEGIRSERQLMESVKLNLAQRWYIGYDLDEEVPNHSTSSKIRDRYGLGVFQRFFEHMVELCIKAGLVWGKELYFDGSRIEANADIDQCIPRFHWEAQQHLASLFVGEGHVIAPKEKARSFVEKYDGTRITGSHSNPQFPRQADTHVCPTDPDATPLYNQPNHSRLGYNLHYVVDGGRSRIILASLVTPGAIQDQTPMLDLQRWVRFRWRIQAKIAVADAKYGSLANIIGLENDGLLAYIPMPDHRHRKQLFSDEDFQYDPDLDHYICPAREILPRSSFDRSRDVYMYRTSAKICQTCALKTQCTSSSYARVVTRSIYQHYIDRVRAYHTTEDYAKAQRKRAVWVEPMFAEAKQWHQLRRFRLRGLLKVNIQALLTAAGQNLKRILNLNLRKPTPNWPNLVALGLPHQSFHELCLIGNYLYYLSSSTTFFSPPTFSTGCSETEHL